MASTRKRKLPSGKTAWVVDYVDAGGVRRNKNFETKRAADTFLIRAASEVATGIHVADSASITVREAADLWLKHVEAGGLEHSTVLHYQQHANLHIVPFLGGLKLTQVNTPRVYAYLDELKAEGRSTEMIRRALQSLGRLFKFAKGRGLVGTNPVADVTLKRSKRDKGRVAIPTRDELRSIVKGASGRWRPLIITTLFSGLRASEIRGLRWSDVDLDRKVLTVSQRADAWKQIGLPKTDAGTRDVPISPLVVAELKVWKLACPKGDLGLVFPNGAGRVEDHANIVARGWNPLQVEGGIVTWEHGKDKDGNPIKIAKPKYNFHALRHAAASMFIESGMNPKRVQSVMGHSSIQVTFDIYGHLFADAEGDQAALRTIEERLFG